MTFFDSILGRRDVQDLAGPDHAQRHAALDAARTAADEKHQSAVRHLNRQLEQARLGRLTAIADAEKAIADADEHAEHEQAKAALAELATAFASWRSSPSFDGSEKLAGTIATIDARVRQACGAGLGAHLLVIVCSAAEQAVERIEATALSRSGEATCPRYLVDRLLASARSGDASGVDREARALLGCCASTAVTYPAERSRLRLAVYSCSATTSRAAREIAALELRLNPVIGSNAGPAPASVLPRDHGGDLGDHVSIGFVR